MDMGPAFAKSATTHVPTAVRCIDPFHAVKLVTDGLDTVRRQTWQQRRTLDADAARKFKGARWALLKRPDTLTDDQAATCASCVAAAVNSGAPTPCVKRSERSSLPTT